jgi:phage terminase small subunit
LLVKQPNARQQRFAIEYLSSGNATEAAKRAGYSEKTAYSQGQRLLKNVEVKRIVREKLDQEEVIAGEVLRELKRIGLVDPRTFFDATGNLKPVHVWTPEMAAAVSSIDVITRKAGSGQVEVVHKIRFSPKTPALEMLCKHLGLFDEYDPNAGQPDVPAFILPPGSRVSIT